MSMNTNSDQPYSATAFARFGYVVVLVVFGGLLAWSMVAPIQGAIVAGGQVVVEGNRKAVQHLEGGVIGDLLVREGDTVKAGAIVARLDDTVQKASVALLDEQLTELYAQRVRLETERGNATSFGPIRGVEAVLNSNAIKDKLDGQKQLFDARRKSRETQVSLLEERIVQQKERIGGLKMQIASLADQLSIYDEEIHGLKKLDKQGFTSKPRLRQLERESRRSSGEKGALIAEIASAQSSIAEANLEIRKIDEGFRESAIEELRAVETKIVELQEQRIAAADKLRRTEIRAPLSGRVINMSVHTVGGVIGAGEPLMEIVPESDRLQIEVHAAPQDVDKLFQGQQALLRFTAFGTKNTPEVSGSVANISADRLTSPKTGEPYYLVLLNIADDENSQDVFEGKKLVPGMPAEALIKTGRKTAISYFLKPLSDAMARSLREE